MRQTSGLSEIKSGSYLIGLLRIGRGRGLGKPRNGIKQVEIRIANFKVSWKMKGKSEWLMHPKGGYCTHIYVQQLL